MRRWDQEVEHELGDLEEGGGQEDARSGDLHNGVDVGIDGDGDGDGDGEKSQCQLFIWSLLCLFSAIWEKFPNNPVKFFLGRTWWEL